MCGGTGGCDADLVMVLVVVYPWKWRYAGGSVCWRGL